MTVAAIAGPVYLRNTWLTGSPIPMTRDQKGPAVWWENYSVIRERRLGDYLVKAAREAELMGEGKLNSDIQARIVGLDRAAQRFPALQFHDLTTQQPYQVWLALDRKAWKPKVSDLPVNIVRFGQGPVYNEGVEHHHFEGVEVKIYNPAKTVADCFKYRNKIGMNVALEALRDC